MVRTRGVLLFMGLLAFEFARDAVRRAGQLVQKEKPGRDGHHEQDFFHLRGHLLLLFRWRLYSLLPSRRDAWTLAEGLKPCTIMKSGEGRESRTGRMWKEV